MPAIDTIASYQGTSPAHSPLGPWPLATRPRSATSRSRPTARILAALYDSVTIGPALARAFAAAPRQRPGHSVLSLASHLPKSCCRAARHQIVEPQDTLTFELSTAAATGKALGALLIYYGQLPGAAARLYNPGDIKPLIRNIKPVVVTITSAAPTRPASGWTRLITGTESLLHANTDYAVLGLVTDTAVVGPGRGDRHGQPPKSGPQAR
jgi:hypothetical protein